MMDFTHKGTLDSDVESIFMSWHQFEWRHGLVSATMILFYKLLIDWHQLDYVPHNYLSKYNAKAV